MMLSFAPCLLKDSSICFGTIAREVVFAISQVGYIIAHFMYPFLKSN